jgi:hypothetical protein
LTIIMPSSRHHTEWLSLIEVFRPVPLPAGAGASLSQGLDAHDPDHARLLKRAFDEWQDNQEGDQTDPAIHRAWVEFVLQQTLTLGLPEELLA